jgi:hypothetical protein
MPRRACLLLAATLLLGACRKEAAPGLTREQFVRVNVALRLVPDSTPDTRARRDSILAREKVTRAELEAWVRRNASGDVLQATWREIAAAVDSARPAPVRPTLPPSEGGVTVIKDSAGPPDPMVLPRRVPDSLLARPGQLRRMDDMLRERGERGTKRP